MNSSMPDIAYGRSNKTGHPRKTVTEYNKHNTVVNP